MENLKQFRDYENYRFDLFTGKAFMFKFNHWEEMKLIVNKNGYYCISLYNKGKKQFRLNRIICEIVNGPCPQGMECRHLDGNKRNNHKDNLKWGTSKENNQDKRKHGTSLVGETNKFSKLTNNDVLMIRYLYKFCTQTEIAKIYNIDRGNIGYIVNRKTWKHI